MPGEIKLLNRAFCWLVLSVMLSCAVPAVAEQVMVGQFSALAPGGGLPAGWEPLNFPNISRHTEYSLVSDLGTTVVRANSEAAASGLIHRYRWSPEKLPWLVWDWKISHVLSKGDVSTKQGDDYAARVYVAFEFTPEDKNFWQRLRYKVANFFSGGELPGSALNYIWANKAPPGTLVSSPYTGQAKMIVLESGNAKAGEWLRERRNIVADYRTAFGRKPPPIMGIAIMTDTDNTGEATTAYYGDIKLTDDRQVQP